MDNEEVLNFHTRLKRSGKISMFCISTLYLPAGINGLQRNKKGVSIIYMMYGKLQNITQMNRIWGYGVLLCLSLAIPAWGLGLFFPLIGGPVFGIITGIMVGHLIKNKTRIASGVSFVSKRVLQYAVVLLGFGLDLASIGLQKMLGFF